MNGLKEYPMTTVEKFLKEQDIEPALANHKYEVYEAALAMLIKENKMLWAEINILKNRVMRLEK